MHVKIAYGKDARLVDIPDGWVGNRILRVPRVDPLKDVAAALVASLRAPICSRPLNEVLAGAPSLCIAVDDINRAGPLHVLLPLLIRWIEANAGISAARIRLILIEPQPQSPVPDTGEAALDVAQLGGCKVIVHGLLPENQQCEHAGILTNALPVNLNRVWLTAKPRVLVSLVEPRLLWGYGGGRASILPGLASADTRSRYVSAPDRLSHPGVFPGNLRDNPFHLLSLEAMQLAPPDFAIHFTLTREGQVAGLYSGDPIQSHLAAVHDHRESFEPLLPESMDILLTGAGGAPHDSTLADVVRSMVSASRLLKPDGTLVILAQCSNGIGPKEFETILREAKSPTGYFKLIGKNGPPSPYLWLTHQFYRVLARHEVLIHCEGISEDDLWAVGLTPVPDPMEAISLAMETHGQQCKIAVVPDGWRTAGRLREDRTAPPTG